jgi:hypothetical protein
MFCSLMEVPTVCFVNSNSRVCPWAPCNVLTLPRCKFCLLLCPLGLLLVVASFLRCSCLITPWSLIPLLNSSCARRLFLNVHSRWVLGTVLPLSCPWQPCALHCANPGMEGHPFAGGSHLLPRPTISLGLFLWLTTAPYSKMPVPILLLQCSDSFHSSLLFRDLLMHHLGFYFFWICLHIHGLHFLYLGIHLGHQLLLVDIDPGGEGTHLDFYLLLPVIHHFLVGICLFMNGSHFFQQTCHHFHSAME